MSANMPRGGDVATDETGNLISADKVTGTNVYNRQGEKLGSVYDIMLDKRTGQVAYAVMSFGGFLGMGESYHPLPWRALTHARTGMSWISTASALRVLPITLRAPPRIGPIGPTARALIDTTATESVFPRPASGRVL
jgi:hypothetical protein